MTMEATLNVSRCLVNNPAWGENVITNVCTGAVTRVPWQAIDYVLAGMFGALALALLVCLIGMLSLAVRLLIDEF